MRAGRLDQKIRIEKSTETKDVVGGPVITWNTLATVFASVEPISGRELLSADQLQAEATIRVRCRYVPNVTTECRIVHKGRIIDIVFLQNIREGRAKYEILCSESV